MRWRPGKIVSSCGLVAAIAACGGGGGGDGGGGAQAFPQGFLPVELAVAGGRGDVAFRPNGDLYAVDGTADVTAISREDGSVSVFASDVGGASTVLRSVVVGSDGRVFAGDDTGRIYAIASDGSSSSLFVNTGSATPITGLAVAPTGFGDSGGSLVAAAGTEGVLLVSTGESPAATTLADPAESYVDVAFSGTTLFALDATDDEIDTISAAGTVASFQGGFDGPVGMAVDDGRDEILVADAGVDVLRALPVSGGAPTDRAPYDYDPAAPSGIAYDGVGAIAFVAQGSVVIHGAAVGRVDPDFGILFIGPTVGYGDLELDRDGGFLVVANDGDDPLVADDEVTNFLFSVGRRSQDAKTLATGIGDPGEELLSLAVDPFTETIYLGSRDGNVYRRADNGDVSLLVDLGAPVLGLELAPAGFGGFGGRLVATTDVMGANDSRMFVIDPMSPTPPAEIALSEPVGQMVDLVFASDGTLYVLDRDEDEMTSDPISRILEVAPNGDASDLGVNQVALGLPEGIEIDEGGERLLVAVARPGTEQLVAVALSDSAVTVLGTVDLDDGAFPAGVVYDRLGTAVVRVGNTFSVLDAVSTFP